MPTFFKAGMAILILCLLASMAIAIVRLSTTPTEIIGDEFRGLPHQATQGVNDEAQPRR